MADALDDAFDWALGWTRRMQRMLAVQRRSDNDRGLEAENDANEPDAEARSHRLRHVLYSGAAVLIAGTAQAAAMHRLPVAYLAEPWSAALESAAQLTAGATGGLRSLQASCCAALNFGVGSDLVGPLTLPWRNHASPIRGIARSPRAFVGHVTKVGRNAPCPCGSGKKYKKCCMRRAGGLDAEKLALYRYKLSRSLEKERRRREKYGYVRPVISTTFKGLRWVAVGSAVHYSKAWKTVPDFLFYYITVVLGAGWGTNQIKTKPLEERHPILQLYHSHCLLQERHKGTKDADGLYHGELDGPAVAYLQLAYDLYVLGDHLKLQESLVARLKHPDQFQGARYELAVATHCIRAGFDIAYEDETDTSTKHPEFIATHKETGQRIAVEAKSRHRPGVLGFPGEKQEERRAGVRNILMKALAKFDGLPYAVFVDLNLPPHEVGDITELPWLQELIEEIQRLPGNDDEPHPYNLLMFTHYPEHYGAEGAARPGSGGVSVFSRNPRAPVEHPEALKALYDAAHQYGRVPTWFEDEP